MVLPGRTRLAKRKQEIKEVRKEHQTTTSQKHDMKCFEAENKASGVKTLQEKYDNLIEENKKNVALIAELKEELAELAAAKNPTKGTESKETQTKSEFQDYPCNECVYSASCMEELDWHFENYHDYSEPE